MDLKKNYIISDGAFHSPGNEREESHQVYFGVNKMERTDSNQKG